MNKNHEKNPEIFRYWVRFKQDPVQNCLKSQNCLDRAELSRLPSVASKVMLRELSLALALVKMSSTLLALVTVSETLLVLLKMSGTLYWNISSCLTFPLVVFKNYKKIVSKTTLATQNISDSTHSSDWSIFFL